MIRSNGSREGLISREIIKRDKARMSSLLPEGVALVNPIQLYSSTEAEMRLFPIL